MRAQLLTSTVLAIGYALSGWASLQATVPPDYVSVVFPSAGVALAALLIFGNGVWPGIYAGSLLVQLLAGHQSGLADNPLAALLPPFGAVAQAMIGATLARSLIGFPSALDTPRSIMLLLFVLAPVSALINPTLSVPALVTLGVIPAGEWVYSWMHWWLGDTLGILLATPLMFVFLGRPREVWRPRRIAITIPLVAACLLTVLVFSAIRAGDEARLHGQFNREAEGLASLLDKRLSAQVEMLLATERFAALSTSFTREDFRRFVSPILARHDGLLNFTWNPLVAQAQREAFELRASAELRAPYRITDRDESSPTRTAPAAVQTEHFPILYVEPLAANRVVLGLDPLSIERSANAIRLARERGVPVATEPFRLTQDQAQQLGVVIYHGVVRNGTATSLIGIVSNAFRMDDVLERTFAQHADIRIEPCLIDTGATGGPARISGAPGCEQPGWIDVRLALTRPIEFATRNWEVRLRAAWVDRRTVGAHPSDRVRDPQLGGPVASLARLRHRTPVMGRLAVDRDRPVRGRHSCRVPADHDRQHTAHPGTGRQAHRRTRRHDPRPAQAETHTRPCPESRENGQLGNRARLRPRQLLGRPAGAAFIAGRRCPVAHRPARPVPGR